MARSVLGSAVVLAIALVTGDTGATQNDSLNEVALEVVRMSVDESTRARVGEGVTASIIRAVSSSLQERLNRRLLDVEWRTISDIVGRFVRETLPETRIEEIAASVYARHFTEAELREMLAFQRSSAGRKLARLSPTINVDTTRAIDEEVRTSPTMRDMLAELRRAFPVLGTGESP